MKECTAAVTSEQEPYRFYSEGEYDMVYRIFVEKRAGLDMTAASMLKELNANPKAKGVTGLRIVHRYDVEDIDPALFDVAVKNVFSEPQTDVTGEELVLSEDEKAFAVEYLPGQFDQRADSAAQCIQIISCGDRPTVKAATVYVLKGDVTAEAVEAAKKAVINPVDSREASFDKPDTLKTKFAIPTEVETLTGFLALDDDGLTAFLDTYALAMDLDDLKFCRDYFASEKRNPTVTEIRMIDTYWSDHCRHTTFLTTIDAVDFEDPAVGEAFAAYLKDREALGRQNRAVNLMDIATLAVKVLKKQGKLDKLDESEEINACTVKIKVTVDGEEQDWLLLFKNETHNHPTEIEPFGGAATCIGGAIRDPLSGRSYVYAAMRVTGAADPTSKETLPGKLPQKKIVTEAAAGYSSYGNQIGLATGMVDEVYHPGYAAKRMEIGGVIAAAPAENVRRERPAPGDAVILLGGRTGRDGCGGATGSSKSHTAHSLDTCGAEVQKGNAPEERKLQRLFRNPTASKLIKRCNDFGAGGVSVAVGELADGLDIDLNKVPKKYEGLDGTELAISESQERMAVVVEPKDVDTFMALAQKENLEATVIAFVKEDPRLTMTWNGKTVVDLSREFLNSNGAEKHREVKVAKSEPWQRKAAADFATSYKALAADLNVCSKRGLSERFDSTIGAGTVLMPFGGKRQRTPIQAMVHKVSVEQGDTDTCSFMSWGFDPSISEKSPFCGAYLAVVESVCKLIATGASFEDVYLTFQEYFEKPGKDPKRWGKPMAALLGAYKAQTELGIGSIGGKDSMSGSFEKLDVPPTLVSFAVTTGKIADVVSNEFKCPGSKTVLLLPETDENGLPTAASLKALFDTVHGLTSTGKALACYTPTYGGVAEAVLKMCMGNGLGFRFKEDVSDDLLFGTCPGAFVVELAGDDDIGLCLGETTLTPDLARGDVSLSMSDLETLYENKLENVFPCNIPSKTDDVPAFSYDKREAVVPAVKVSKPKMLIPVFPGTNCEYDTAKAAARAGLDPDIFVINNLTAAGVAASAEEFARRIGESQIIFVPGGFSGGDEPDGSGKFITAFFRNGMVAEQVNTLLNVRKGLMCGVCNGFQALIKLGLVPYGEIIDPDDTCPTLTFNTIGRHQSKLVRTRVCSVKSPWFSKLNVGDVLTVPISHGEGRFLADEGLIRKLAENGQIATQYVDVNGVPGYGIDVNPNGSVLAVEGITSPDGRVLGKMGHSERVGSGLYKNVDGTFETGLFLSAKDYFA